MFQVIDEGHQQRPLVEATIRTAFQRGHGAQLATLPRWLVANIDEAGVTCAASLRFAEDGFFSEKYLDRSIEDLIAQHTGIHPDRNDLAEVGGLSAGRVGEVRDMVCGVIKFLQARGTHWAFFTATARLRTYLRRAGIPLIELAAADPSRVDAVEAWGSYYQQDPRVMLVGKDMLCALRHAMKPNDQHRHA